MHIVNPGFPRDRRPRTQIVVEEPKKEEIKIPVEEVKAAAPVEEIVEPEVEEEILEAEDVDLEEELDLDIEDDEDVLLKKLLEDND